MGAKGCRYLGGVMGGVSIGVVISMGGGGCKYWGPRVVGIWGV